MRKIYLALAATLTFLPLFAQEPVAKPEPYNSRPEVYTVGTNQLHYRAIAPRQVEEGKLYPLVIFLHGSGERGSDNRRQLAHGIKSLVTFCDRYGEPSYFIIPQCPIGQRWVDISWSLMKHDLPAKPSASMGLVISLIKEQIRTLPIDPARVYITGLSMGGYGTWDILAREPNLFAAAIPICGGADLACAPRMKHIPIWTFHGSVDQAVPVERSRMMVDALRQAGGNIRYHEYLNYGHNVWAKTYENDVVLRWFFDQRKAK